jgi:hypothetical protein
MMALYNSGALGSVLQDSLVVLLDLETFGGRAVPTDVVKAVRHVCGLLDPNDDLHPLQFDEVDRAAVRYYQTIQRTHGEGAAAAYLAFTSGFFHELRHAHDLLATAYGQSLLFRSFNFYQNAPRLAAALEEWVEADRTRTIPMPLRGHTAALTGFPPELRALIERYETYANETRDFLFDTTMASNRVTVVHLLETSAMNVQLDFVHEVFGDDAEWLLATTIEKSGRAKYYVTIRNEAADRFEAAGFRGEGLGIAINYLIWCALQMTTWPGATINDGPAPVTLFEALTEHVLHTCKDIDPATVRGAVEKFYADWGFLTPDEVSLRHASNFETQAARLAVARGTSDRLDLTGAYAAIARTYSSMNERIRERPEWFFGQREYVWSVLAGYWPALNVKVRYDGTFYDYMTPGEQLIPFDVWSRLANLSTMFNIIVEGRGTSAVRFFEDECFEHLNGKTFRLRFLDRNGPFEGL